MSRALREYRIRGVKTNLLFLNALVTHPRFISGDVTTRFIDETPSCSTSPRTRTVAPACWPSSDMCSSTAPRSEGGPVGPAIEAMKMQTALFVEIDGVVEEVVAADGTHVDAEELLLVVQAATTAQATDPAPA